MPNPIIRMSIRAVVIVSLFTFLLLSSLALSASASSTHATMNTKATTLVQTTKGTPPKEKCSQGWKSKTENGKQVWYCGNKRYK